MFYSMIKIQAFATSLLTIWVDTAANPQLTHSQLRKSMTWESIYLAVVFVWLPQKQNMRY